MPFVFADAPALSPGDFVAHVPAGLTDARALLEALYTRLSLPGYFGFNWNALSDCLRDLSWLGEPRVVLCHADLPPLPEAELRVYLDVLAQAVESWQPAEAHSLCVIFPEAARQSVMRLRPPDESPSR